MAVFWILLGVFLGVAGKYLVDLRLANKKKPREEQLTWSVEFLAAAGRVAQAVAAWCNWQQELRHRAPADPDELTADELAHLTRRPVPKRTRVDAYRARGTVRLLLPDLSSEASDYLDLGPRYLDEKPGAKIEHARRKQIGA